MNTPLQTFYSCVSMFVLLKRSLRNAQIHTHWTTRPFTDGLHSSCWATECSASGSSSPFDWGQCSWEQRRSGARLTAVQLLFQGKWADLRGQPQGERHDKCWRVVEDWCCVHIKDGIVSVESEDWGFWEMLTDFEYKVTTRRKVVCWSSSRGLYLRAVFCMRRATGQASSYLFIMVKTHTHTK